MSQSEDAALALFSEQERSELRRMRSARQYEYIGYCYFCGGWVLRRDARQEVRDESCVFVCRRDDSIIDECPPFH